MDGWMGIGCPPSSLTKCRAGTQAQICSVAMSSSLVCHSGPQGCFLVEAPGQLPPVRQREPQNFPGCPMRSGFRTSQARQALGIVCCRLPSTTTTNALQVNLSLVPLSQIKNLNPTGHYHLAQGPCGFWMACIDS